MKFGENKLSETKPTLECPNPAAAQLEQHLAQLDDYITDSNSNYATFHAEYLEASNMSLDELKNLPHEELFNYSYLLQGYATYIQDEYNRHKIIVNWCNNQIERLVAKHRESFNPYTKHDQRRHIIVAENSFAAKVGQMLEKAESRLTTLEGKVWELKQRSNILLEKGKRT